MRVCVREKEGERGGGERERKEESVANRDVKNLNKNPKVQRK